MLDALCDLIRPGYSPWMDGAVVFAVLVTVVVLVVRMEKRWKP